MSSPHNTKTSVDQLNTIYENGLAKQCGKIEQNVSKCLRSKPRRECNDIIQSYKSCQMFYHTLFIESYSIHN